VRSCAQVDSGSLRRLAVVVLTRTLLHGNGVLAPGNALAVAANEAGHHRAWWDDCR
jgi:hypothetical protein